MEYRPVTNHQKGGLSEALVTSHWYEIYDIFGEWAIKDLREHENEPVTSTDDIRVKYAELEKWDTRLAGTNDEYSWMPDCRYEVRIDTKQTDISDPDAPLHVGTPSYDYLFEIKTGQYGTLKRDQRDVMEHIEASNDHVVPIRVRVDISDLPDTYGISFTRIHATTD